MLRKGVGVGGGSTLSGEQESLLEGRDICQGHWGPWEAEGLGMSKLARLGLKKLGPDVRLRDP